MYKIGICDDGKETCFELKSIIETHIYEMNQKICIQCWNSGEEVVAALNEGEKINLLFLDIEMLKTSGLDVADFVRNKLEDRGMQIVFISYTSKYVMDLFKTQPLDFLIKPFDREKIKKVLELAIRLDRRNNTNFEFQFAQQYFSIPYAEIAYFMSEGRKIKLKTAKEQYSFYGKLKDVERELPEEFISIHQSFIVNRRFAEHFTYETVTLTDGEIFSISKKYRAKVKKQIARRM